MKNNLETATVYRHVRPHNDDGELFAKGGFVLAFEMNFGKNIRIGVAACRDDENFYKRIGNETALKALNSDAHIVMDWKLYSPEVSLVENAKAACALAFVKTAGEMPSVALKKFCVFVCSEEIEDILSYLEQSGH